MPSKARMYGELLKDVLERTRESKHKAMFRAFKSLLIRRGDLAYLGKAVQEFKNAWKNRKGKIGTVVFAQNPSARVRQSAAKALKKRGFVYEEKIDPDLVGGTAIFLGNDYLVDNSIKRKLDRITHISISVNQLKSA